MTTTHPTVEHAKQRAKVTLTSRGGWCGVIFWVDERRGLGKVRLPSGKVLRLPLDDLVLDDARSKGETQCTTSPSS